MIVSVLRTAVGEGSSTGDPCPLKRREVVAALVQIRETQQHAVRIDCVDDVREVAEALQDGARLVVLQAAEVHHAAQMQRSGAVRRESLERTVRRKLVKLESRRIDDLDVEWHR